MVVNLWFQVIKLILCWRTVQRSETTRTPHRSQERICCTKHVSQSTSAFTGTQSKSYLLWQSKTVITQIAVHIYLNVAIFGDAVSSSIGMSSSRSSRPSLSSRSASSAKYWVGKANGSTRAGTCTGRTIDLSLCAKLACLLTKLAGLAWKSQISENSVKDVPVPVHCCFVA